MATDIRAELKNCGVSAQKTRLVIDLIRGKPAVEALTTLKFTNKAAARHVGRLLASAVKRTSASTVMIWWFTRSALMMPLFANGADLAPADASSRC